MSKKDTVQFKEGDRVLVKRRRETREKKPRTYLFTDKNGMHVCVGEGNAGWELGDLYCPSVWDYIKPLEEQPNLEGKTVEIDGREYLLTIKN